MGFTEILCPRDKEGTHFTVCGAMTESSPVSGPSRPCEERDESDLTEMLPGLEYKAGFLLLIVSLFLILIFISKCLYSIHLSRLELNNL